MSNAILFTATENDWQELRAFIMSLGLHIVPDGPGLAAPDGKIQGGFISQLPESQLQVYPKLGTYLDVWDPLLSFNCGAEIPGYFQPGRIEQNLDVDHLASQTKSNFGKISRWIRKNWPKPEGMYRYSGPEAAERIRAGQLIVTDLVPGVAITYIPIERHNWPERDLNG